MRTRLTVSVCLAFVCCAYVLCAFFHPALAEDTIINAWVWNSERCRVRLYQNPDLTNDNRFYAPYLLNGYPVRILEWNESENSACVAFFEHTYWVDCKHICTSPPENAESPIYRTTIEEISLPSPNEGTIPTGTRVNIRGYLGLSVIIDYGGELLEIHPSSLQLREITYDAPEYFLSQAEIIALCKQDLMDVYGLSASSIENMRIEFISYSTLSSPALCIVHFYTDTGESYTLHYDGEAGLLIDTYYSPYGVG